MLLRASLIVWLCCSAVARDGIWLDVPYVEQEKNGCGAAVIAMVMQYWRMPADSAAIQRQLYSPEARGIHASAMQRYLQGEGFRTFALKGEWSDLKDHLEKGRPLIVALQPSSRDLHYVVVTGLDWKESIVMMHDPAGRKLQKAHRRDFENEWKAAGNWLLLALPAFASSR